MTDLKVPAAGANARSRATANNRREPGLLSSSTVDVDRAMDNRIINEWLREYGKHNRPITFTSSRGDVPATDGCFELSVT